MMKQTAHEFKYQKHSEKQYMSILSVAERLIIEKGIDKVNLADIANECGIMRSTFYRYFRNKDEILWHIMRRHTILFSKKLMERFCATVGTAYDRYQTFLDVLYEIFMTNTDFYLFLDLFNETYQYVTTINDNNIYNEVYQTDDFGSGDTVRFLMDNFHDGSLKTGLDPKATAVTFTYGAISIVAGMSKQVKTLNTKYGVFPENVIRFNFSALLESVKA